MKNLQQLLSEKKRNNKILEEAENKKDDIKSELQKIYLEFHKKLISTGLYDNYSIKSQGSFKPIKEMYSINTYQFYTSPSYKKEKVTVYECSDGKQFTSENDDNSRYKTGKEMADEYEEKLSLQNIAKKELKFYSITNDKHDNEGFERSFCFYYKPDLSKETINVLFSLVYNIRYQDDIKKLEEGWYLVEQNVYEVDSSCRSQQYDCDGHFELLSEFIDNKEKNLNHYKNLFKTINQ